MSPWPEVAAPPHAQRLVVGRVVSGEWRRGTLLLQPDANGAEGVGGVVQWGEE